MEERPATRVPLEGEWNAPDEHRAKESRAKESRVQEPRVQEPRVKKLCGKERSGRRPVRRVLIVAGVPVLLIFVWWAYSVVSESFYAPTPWEVAQAFADTWFSARLVEDALPSVARLLAGYVLATLAGVGFGVAIGLSSRLRAAAEPVLEFFRAIPPPLLIPPIMLLAGIDDGMKVLVIASGCIWPILLNTVEGVRALDEVLSDTCRMYGVRGASRLRHLVLRGASPQIMPFAAVDAQTRADLEDLILALWRDLGVTTLFVTHDIDEAVYLGRRVIVLSSSPTVVLEDLKIDLPPGRDQLTTRSLPRFADLRGHLYAQIQRARGDR
jgi:ABC-type nitrate/sulfonate/bicarbonate transport system permease component